MVALVPPILAILLISMFPIPAITVALLVGARVIGMALAIVCGLLSPVE